MIQPAQSYSGQTVALFNQFGNHLLAENPDHNLIIATASSLLYSITYSAAPSRPIELLRHLFIDIAHRSQFSQRSQ